MLVLSPRGADRDQPGDDCLRSASGRRVVGGRCRTRAMPRSRPVATLRSARAALGCVSRTRAPAARLAQAGGHPLTTAVGSRDLRDAALGRGEDRLDLALVARGRAERPDRAAPRLERRDRDPERDPPHLRRRGSRPPVARSSAAASIRALVEWQIRSASARNSTLAIGCEHARSRYVVVGRRPRRSRRGARPATTSRSLDPLDQRARCRARRRSTSSPARSPCRCARARGGGWSSGGRRSSRAGGRARSRRR